jgi:HSP20 family protein
MVATREAMRETEKNNRETDSGAKEHIGNREMTKPSSTAPVPVRHGMMSNWNYEPFRRMRDEFDRMFEQFFRGWPTLSEGGRQAHWGLDVQEDDGSVMVRADAPGFEPSEFDLHVRGDQLMICACHKAESQDKQRGMHEWQHQEFHRTISLPAGVDPDKVDANYKNGVLTVTLGKTEAAKSKRISVKG